MKKLLVITALVATLGVAAMGLYAAKCEHSAKTDAKASGCPMSQSEKQAACAHESGTAAKAKGGCCPTTDKQSVSPHGKCPAMGTKGSHHVAKAKAAPKKAKTQSAVCPVMKSKIPDVKKAAGKSVYKGKTYYFCCGGCKPQFDKNPGKYVGKG